MPKNILVADDSLTIRKVIGMVLSNEDMQVTLVDNGLEAIQRARDSRPDVVVADVMMPGKSGYEVCQALKQDPSTSHIPVLLLAGTFEPFDENRARASGADMHIAKPFESQAFIDKVRGLLGLAPGQAMIPTYGPVSTASAVPARPAPSGPGPGAPSGPPPGGMPGTRPMPGPAGMPGQPGPRPPGPGPGGPMMGRPPGGIPGGTQGGVRNPMMAPGPGGMQRPPGPGPGMPGPGGPMMGRPPGPGGPMMGRPPGMVGGPPPPGGFARPPGPGPGMPGGGVPPPGARRDPFGLGGPQGPGPGRPMQPGGRPMAPPQQQQQTESLSLDDRPADGGEAALRAALSKASKEVIEKIAWEVVPQLAETIIREELDRLIKDRETKH